MLSFNFRLYLFLEFSNNFSFAKFLAKIFKYYTEKGVNIAIRLSEFYEFQKAYLLLLGVLKQVGYSSYTPLPNTMYQGTGSSSSYVQNNLQNLNNEGSADYVVTADNGSDTHGYLDMGLAGQEEAHSEAETELHNEEPMPNIWTLDSDHQEDGNLLDPHHEQEDLEKPSFLRRFKRRKASDDDAK